MGSFSRNGVEYRLVKRLAAGGMADLFLAQAFGRRGYERTVVIKTVRSDAQDPQPLIRSLLDEAAVGRRIEHPNVVQLLDADEDPQRPHLIFEFIFGRDLAQVRDRLWAENRPMPLPAILTIMREVLAALVHVHRGDGDAEFQAVHRDVSPQNILVSFEGLTKLADFGLVKAAFLEGSTATGMVKGKAAYMAPEQLTTRTALPESDVFSLGVVLWELLAGRRMFYQQDDTATAQAVLSMAVPWVSNPERPVPRKLAWVCWRATRRRRGLRYRSAESMLQALEAVDRRPIEAARTELADWMRGLFAERLFRRERHAASFEDPVKRRQVLDAGFELTPEVTETRAPEGLLRRPSAVRSKRAFLPWAVLVTVALGLFFERLWDGQDHGTVRFTGTPGTRVQWNGQLLGSLPLPPLAVEPGRHEVGVDGERTVELWVRARERKTVDLD